MLLKENRKKKKVGPNGTRSQLTTGCRRSVLPENEGGEKKKRWRPEDCMDSWEKPGKNQDKWKTKETHNNGKEVKDIGLGVHCYRRRGHLEKTPEAEGAAGGGGKGDGGQTSLQNGKDKGRPPWENTRGRKNRLGYLKKETDGGGEMCTLLDVGTGKKTERTELPQKQNGVEIEKPQGITYRYGLKTETERPHLWVISCVWGKRGLNTINPQPNVWIDFFII